MPSFGNGFLALAYVDSRNRREGIGEALVSHIESCCRTPKLFTSTNESTRPMRTLLEKGGYVPSGIIENLDANDPGIVHFKPVGPEAVDTGSVECPGCGHVVDGAADRCLYCGYRIGEGGHQPA